MTMHVARVALPSVTATQAPPLSVESLYSGSIVYTSKYVTVSMASSAN